MSFMRKFLLLFPLAGLLGCGPQPEVTEVQFSGSLENLPGAAVELDFFRDHINNDRKIVELDPDHEGVFNVAFEVPEPVMGTLNAGRSTMQVYLEPGFAMYLEGDARRLPQDAEFEGLGSVENNFLVAYYDEVESGLGRTFLNEQAGELTPEEYLDFAARTKDIKLNFLSEHPEAHAMSANFIHFFETRVAYEKYQQLLDYPSLHQRMNDLDEAPDLPLHYYDFLDDATRFDGDRLNNLTYVNFLLNYLDHMRETGDRVFAEDKSRHEINYALAEDHLTGRSKYYIQALSVSRELHSGDIDLALEMYDHFMEHSPVEEYNTRLENAYETLQGLWAGNPAPDFTMTDLEGNEFSLSDYHGKVVYLKFWASWCGPCMREVPPAAEMKERMAGEDDLVFMYVSIDVNPDAWQNTIEAHEITGVHARTPGRERGVPALYNVRWIPTFYLIGRDGNIYDHRPPNPSDPEIDDVLEAALRQQ